MATSKSAWSGFERVIASDFSGLLDKPTFRVPLSGVSSRHNGGDVIVPRDSDGNLKHDILFEAKYRTNNAQHTLYKSAQDDSVKNGVDAKHAILCTKVKRQQGYLVTISDELFWELMRLPGALNVFRKV